MSETTQTTTAMPPRDDVFKRGTYVLGDGEVRSIPRPGSQDALAVPSLYGKRLHYRDGRVEPLVRRLPSDDTEGGDL
jgi:hypothetical protein